MELRWLSYWATESVPDKFYPGRKILKRVQRTKLQYLTGPFHTWEDVPTVSQERPNDQETRRPIGPVDEL